MTIGDYVLIGDDCVVEVKNTRSIDYLLFSMLTFVNNQAASIGSCVNIGKNCIIGENCTSAFSVSTTTR